MRLQLGEPVHSFAGAAGRAIPGQGTEASLCSECDRGVKERDKVPPFGAYIPEAEETKHIKITRVLVSDRKEIKKGTGMRAWE